MSVVRLETAVKSYPGHVALKGVSLEVTAGRCVALVGHNGAGKTTLMKLILGLIPATSGNVSVLGSDPARAGKEFRRSIGFLPENVAFHDELTGADTLTFLARLKGAQSEEVPELLARVGLGKAAGRRVKTYSKGMRQRLGLAQALLGAPKLLLLDEPTTGLDPVLRQEFFEIIRELTRAGTTVILSSHILTELEARIDLAAIIRDGELVAYGDLDALRRQAGLSVTVRAKGDAPAIAKTLNGAFQKTLLPDSRAIDISCAGTEKMALLRRLTSLGEACSDVEIRPPSLDDLYLHFSKGAPVVTRDEEANS